MSADRTGDVSLINDEDLLRKMWQDTEDFGRKKEIRAHMYKLREARLRDFYNSGEVKTDIQRTSTTTTESTSKSCSASTHADSLADHSFISMKTKEIRDSESPTKDDVYRVTDKALSNQGWTTITSSKTSDDGKTFTTSKVATTSGVEKIQGGQLNYAAKNEQQATVCTDGDERNATKTVGASSNSFIKQEASGGDENSSFKCSSTKSSSSSKYVTESRSTSGDIIEIQPASSKVIVQNQNDDYLVSRKTYTDNIPSELKKHPSYVEGKTKVTQETRTLPDGTTMTTTKYEIRGGSTSQSVRSSQRSSEQKTSSTSSVRSSQAETRTTKYISEQPSSTTTTTTRRVVDSNNTELQPAATTQIRTQAASDQQTERDNRISKTTIQDSQRSDSVKVTSSQTVTDLPEESRFTRDSNITSTKVEKQEYGVKSENQVIQNTDISNTTKVVKEVYDSREKPLVTDLNVTTRKVVEDVRPTITTGSDTTTVRTTVVKEIADARNQLPVVDDSTRAATVKTTVTKQISDFRDETQHGVDQTSRINKHEVSDQFIRTEKLDNQQRSEQTKSKSITSERPKLEEKSKTPERPLEPQEKYEIPEKRQPIKPGKSELDEKPKPTEGQYDTTYRTDYTNKRISVEVSPTHEAFARSLRAVSPDRFSKCSSPSRSLRTSNNSLRSSTSPEKVRHPSRVSPERRSTSPRKNTCQETVTYRTKTSNDTYTRVNSRTEIDSSTLTKKKNKTKIRSRSPSPTSVASDIEFIKNTNIITDLDTNETTVITNLRPSSLEINKKTAKKVAQRSPTSPLTDASPKKSSPRDVSRTSSLRNISPTRESPSKSDRPLKRTDTYEERCREILGITNEASKKKTSVEKSVGRRGSGPKNIERTVLTRDISASQKSSVKDVTQTAVSSEKQSPKERPGNKGRPTGSPNLTDSLPRRPSSPEVDKKSPTKDIPKISEIKRSPEKEPLKPYPTKSKGNEQNPTISEFPSQIRKVKEKEPVEPYPEKKSPVKNASKISEFPSQTKRPSEREPIKPCPGKEKVTQKGPTLSEFPSQIRKIQEKQHLEPYPEKKSPVKEAPKISEFPSQIRKSPEKEPLELYPKKEKDNDKGPAISEFPSQIRKVQEKEPLEPYPEKKSPIKETPQINEFPSQIRRSPEREPLEPYPKKEKDNDKGPAISEFPSQIRKVQEKEPLQSYPERKSPVKETSKISEFPSQIRRSPEREPSEPYPKKEKDNDKGPAISEFPSQIRKVQEKEPLEPYPKKKSPVKEAPKISEFPAQVRRSPEREPLEPYPKKEDNDKGPTIIEFPSQIRKVQEEEPLKPNPEEKSLIKESPEISEFPSQIRELPEKEPLEPDQELSKPYEKKTSPLKDTTKPSDVSSQVIKTAKNESSEPHPEGRKPSRETPQDYRKKPQNETSKSEKRPLSPDKKIVNKFTPAAKDTSKTSEIPHQKRRSPEKGETRADKFPIKVKETPEKGRVKPSRSEYNNRPISKPSPKENKPKQRTQSLSSSSTTDEEKDIEETFSSTRITELEERIPVEEPLVTKKFISQLCKDDEIQRSDLTKIETQSTLNKELLTSESKTYYSKSTKKDTPKKAEELFIEVEKKDTAIKSVPTSISSSKRPLTEKNNLNTGRIINTASTKTDTRASKKITEEKSRPTDLKKGKDNVTLMDIENLNKSKEDKTIHVRTHRVDDTVSKRVTTKTSINGDISRKTPTRSQPVKTEESKVKLSVDRKTQKTGSRTVVTTNETKRGTNEQKTPKRHVVTTTITVTSGRKPAPIKATSKATFKVSDTKTSKKKKVQNGHADSDDESITESLDNRMTQEKRVTRTDGDELIKKKTNIHVPLRETPKTEAQASKIKQEKCITTKSIVINNEDQREIIVDLQRSKSSREPTPDRICPLPVSSDDEATPRYPDQIAEPEDSSSRFKTKRISDIPISENEYVPEFRRIIEIDDTDIEREEADVSRLSIDKKIDKFSTTKERVLRSAEGPAPKIERPKLEVSEDLESDECLLSVSEKVNKFITTAEHLTASQDASVRPKSPKCQFYAEDDVSVSDKVAHFINTAEEIVTQKRPLKNIEKPCITETDKTVNTEKKSEFSDTTEKIITTSNGSVSLSKIDIQPTSQKQDEEAPKRIPSKETTPTRNSSIQYTSVKPDTQNKHLSRDSSPKLPDSTPKSTRRSSEEIPRSVLSPTGRLRSTESVKKAKALFENITKPKEIPKQRDILSRPSIFEGRKAVKTEVSRKLEYENEEDKKTLKSTEIILDKVRSRPKSPEKDSSSRRSQSPESDIPGYMRPLDRSLRPNSPHRDNVTQLNQISKKHTTLKDDEDSSVRQTKFGVTLKRTDSGKAIVSTAATSTKIQTTAKQITEEEIENIFDLEILEELLEKVIGYDLRRKIRTQIRLIKKMIEEGKLTAVTKTITTREKSPQKTIVSESKKSTEQTSEYRSSYSYSERKSSSVIRRSQSPDVARRSISPEVKSDRTIRKSQSPDSNRNQEKSADATKTTKLFSTVLKKTSPSSKTTPPEESAPEWVKQRNLKKVTDTAVSATRNISATTAKRTRSSPNKETKPTDSITSSYGVGPTDENGTPLFGLRALRTQNKTDATKVQGTVIRSQYYSENGEEPVGEISVTKYSTDPKDLGRSDDAKSAGITSITTTQRFGYKDTPSLRSLTSSKKKKEICENVEDEVKTKTNKINRRGSVKALSQKFIENAVETSKSERQSSYPKAGLILRTSSFKESASSGDSREGSTERNVTVKTSTSKTVSGETFLTSRTKVTGMQDVISRMKSEDIREGDTAEDIEARGLLNKFIGTQVILSGIESKVKASTTTTNAKRTTKVTTTTTEEGKPVTRTRVFEHPLTDEILETIWDEQSLRLLLEQSTDYDERRRIRGRLRQVMAEQEACTESVEKASQEQIGSSTFEGESQLLPLLQGLLEAPDNEQTADSGTESGEDQRSGLIAEVQNALSKLAANLRDDATDITPEKRSSLLQLVTKLQAGLSASVPTTERRSSVQSRFRRRQRPNRHTVGVSSEELADARRLIEEISLHDLTPQSSHSKIPTLQKQNSESSVGQSSASSFKPFLPQKTVVKNAVAKPFSSSNSTVSGNSSSVQTPTEASESLDFVFNEETTEKKPDFSYRSFSTEEQTVLKSSSGDLGGKSIQNSVKEAAARKSTENLVDSEETDEDSTVKAQSVKSNQKQVSNMEECREVPSQQLIMQNNPIYLQQKSLDVEVKSNKFNSKKIKMKRANTIDIPKPLKFYEEHGEDDSDTSLPEEDYYQRRRNTYLALRGPIRVGNPNNKNALPVFEPKTDNDKKFLAFINKHNENNTVKNTFNKNSLWAKPETSAHGSIWSNKFGNIKTTFEKASSETPQSQNSARQFWKSADDAVTAPPKYDGPKISKQNARNLRQMFEEKQKQSQKLPWSTVQNDKNVVTGSLRVKAFEPQNEKTHKFVPQPLPVNKFSHAPQSAFKPIPKKPPPVSLQISKTPIKSDEKGKDLDSPLFLYSPKPPMESSLKPWVTSPGESRVLTLAASKFESVAPQEPDPIKPRKLSKDKITLPFQQQSQEKLTAPYLVKSVEQKNNTVKQLKGQYDNCSGQGGDTYTTYNTVKYSSPQAGSYTQPYRNQQEYGQTSSQQNRYTGLSYNTSPPEENVPNRYSITSQRQLSQEYYPVTSHQNIPHSVSTQQRVTNQGFSQTPPRHLVDAQYSKNPYQNQQYSTCLPQNCVHPHNQTSSANYASHAYVSQIFTHPTVKGDARQQQNAHIYRQNEELEDEKINRRQINVKNNTDPPESVEVNDCFDSNQNEPQYTSTYHYQPKIQTPPPPKIRINQEERHKYQNNSVENHEHPPKLDSQVSVEGVQEYNAVSSRVMTGPVSQQATTVRQKSPMSRDEHDIAAALSLKSTLQKVCAKSNGSLQKIKERTPSNESRHGDEQRSPATINYKPHNDPPSASPSNSRSEDSSPSNSPCSPKNFYGNVCSTTTSRDKEELPKFVSPTNHEQPKKNVSTNSFSYKPREQRTKQVSPHSFSYNAERQGTFSNSCNYGYEKRSVPVHSLEINDNGESIVTSKFQIPVINVPQPESPRPPSQAQMANKADSWSQICMQNQQPLHKPSPRASPSARAVAKSKSSHSLLVVPKQFEAGMTKDEVAQKRKTMEAYLGGGNKSPQSLSRASSNENVNNKSDSRVVKRSINRLKTSEKVSSTYRQSSSLSRSRTLPDIVCPDLLDETNVDKAFEDLFISNM